MSMSGNVVQDTMAVLQKAKDLAGAAETLNITEAGLRYRISQNPKLMALAIERGLYTPRAKTESMPEGKAPEPPEDTKAPDPVQTAAPAPKNKDRTHKRHKDGWKTFDVSIPVEFYDQLLAMAAREMRHVNVQAGYLLRNVLEGMR